MPAGNRLESGTRRPVDSNHQWHAVYYVLGEKHIKQRLLVPHFRHLKQKGAMIQGVMIQGTAGIPGGGVAVMQDDRCEACAVRHVHTKHQHFMFRISKPSCQTSIAYIYILRVI